VTVLSDLATLSDRLSFIEQRASASIEASKRLPSPTAILDAIYDIVESSERFCAGLPEDLAKEDLIRKARDSLVSSGGALTDSFYKLESLSRALPDLWAHASPTVSELITSLEKAESLLSVLPEHPLATDISVAIADWAGTVGKRSGELLEVATRSARAVSVLVGVLDGVQQAQDSWEGLAGNYSLLTIARSFETLRSESEAEFQEITTESVQDLVEPCHALHAGRNEIDFVIDTPCQRIGDAIALVETLERICVEVREDADIVVGWFYDLGVSSAAPDTEAYASQRSDPVRISYVHGVESLFAEAAECVLLTYQLGAMSISMEMISPLLPRLTGEQGPAVEGVGRDLEHLNIECVRIEDTLGKLVEVWPPGICGRTEPDLSGSLAAIAESKSQLRHVANYIFMLCDIQVYEDSER
jgi:hypothetical protein